MKNEYGEYYKKYNMNGEIKIGSGIVQVHDIFGTTPEFMKTADVLFSDPPCSKGNLTSFYTKAEKTNLHDYLSFYHRFFDVVNEISPRLVFVEVFKTNYDLFFEKLSQMYQNIHVLDSMYYNNKKNQCWIIIASSDKIPENIANLPRMDEELIIKYICENLSFDCIADPCIGKGLVAFYANMFNKKFVGTELNYKRLAVCVERVLTNKRGKIK